MLLNVKIQRFSGVVSGILFAISALLAFAFVAPSAVAQTGAPVKIGFSMSLTGGLGPNGRSALLAQKIWEEDTNSKGGLLGRPVKLIYYDDQTNPATVPGIYAKLARRRQSRPDHRWLRHKLAGASNADRHAAKEGIHRSARDRGE